MSERLTRHFTVDEFRCPCCGQCKMDHMFMRELEAFRVAWGKPFSPVEGGGYRCEAYDGKRGAHTEGRAIDPGIAREDMHAFLKLAFAHGFTGIGAKQHKGRWQVHLDMAEAKLPARPRPWFWTYG
jgi:hypothetical protein